MNNYTLDQKSVVDFGTAVNTTTNVQRKSRTSIPKVGDRGYALGLDTNLLQDSIKCKSTKAARNLDTLQRIVYSLFSIWRGCRKKLSDKDKGMAELIRLVSSSITKLLRFLSQK